jgi:Tfp pilus assembly protein PilN
MSISQSSLGIEIRQDRIIVSHLRKFFKQLRVIKSDILPLTPAKAKEEGQLELINTLQRCLNDNSYPKDNVVLALPREKALLKLTEVPAAAKENLRKVLEYELGKHIPFPPEEASFDFQVLEEKGGLLRVLLVVVKKDDVTEILGVLKRIGIRPVAIEIASTASANLFYFDEHPAEAGPQVLIDIRNQSCEFHFFEKGEFKGVFHFSFRNEEEKGKELTEAYRQAMLKGLGPKDGQGTLLVYGDGASSGLVDELKQTLSSNLAPVQSLKKIVSGNGSQKIGESYSSIGLALRGLARTKWNLNLIPMEMRKKVSRLGYYLAVFLTVAAVVLAGAWGIHPFLEEREELERVLLQVKAKKPEVEAIEALQKKRDVMDKEVREFEALRADEVSKLDVLKELAEILPPTAWLWKIRVKAKEVELSGFAESASDLIGILDKSPVFEKVKFASPVTKEMRLFGANVVKERFQINGEIEKVK